MSGARLSLALLLAASSLVVQARDYAYSDAHLHYVDFFQETAGMDKLLKAMADNRIEHVMISGIPVAKKWHEDEPKRPRYYAGDDADAYWYSATDVIVAAAVNKLSPEQRQHCHPFLAGFNPNDKNSAAHIQRMLDLNPGLWQGIGEVFTRHDDLTALTSGDTPRANNEAMTRIYHLAAENDLPVLLHSNITSKRERNPLYLAEVEEPLRNHPHTRFIWAHAGGFLEKIHVMQVRVAVGIVTGLHGKAAGGEQQGETQAGSRHGKTSIRVDTGRPCANLQGSARKKPEHWSASMLYNCMTFILRPYEVCHACYRQYAQR